MDNATEALKMAGAMLIFVLAISIIIFSFSNVRKTADTILDSRDRDTYYVDTSTYLGEEVAYYNDGTTNRNVSLETIIPSIFRAYLENYKIVFEGFNNPIYKLQGGNLPVTWIDLSTNRDTPFENAVLANDRQKADFLRGILYHDNFSTDANKKTFERRFNVKIDNSCKSIYDQLKNATRITEALGVYYQNDSPEEPNVNKTEKRIITYTVYYD